MKGCDHSIRSTALGLSRAMLSEAAAPGHPPVHMSLSPARSFALLTLACGLACSAEPPRADFPGTSLLTRIEARLDRERAALKPMLAHYGLVFPVEQDELTAFMGQVRFHGSGLDLALGTDYALEPHGGGLLRLLFDYWRPDSRAPRLDDRYWFAANRRHLALGQLYAAGRGQVFLPVPGVATEATGGRLPDSPQLPRMFVRFGLPGGPVRTVESDAYKLLSLLIELEPDPSRSWLNRSGQQLSVELLMRHVRASYLASSASFVDPPDHSNLHLVELLVTFGSAGPARELAAIQRHFLTVELAQRAFDPRDAGFLLAHYVESLGQLLETSALDWSEDDKRRVRSWLVDLEERRFRDIAAEDLERLCHLAKGLRSVRARQAELQ